MMLLFVFFGLVVALAAWPLFPAIREWRRPTDTAPLKVAQNSEVDVRHLANGFRDWVTRHLSEAVAACRGTGLVQQGEIDGVPYAVVPGAQQPFLAEAEAKRGRIDRILVGCESLRIPERLTVARELFVDGSLVGGRGAVFRAILAAGDVALGPESRTLRWLHADGTVILGEGSRGHGRVSAGAEIRLAPGCEFERLHAPRIVIGEPAPAAQVGEAPELPVLGPGGIKGGVVVATNAGRWLIRGNVEIPANVRVETNLVVTGKCRLSRGVVLAGSVKAHGDLVLEPQVRVTGGTVTERRLFVGRNCRLEGAVIAERTAEIGAGTIIGDPARPTTLSALDLVLAPGVVVHGTAWAHRRGRVATPASAAEAA
jgi:predicted acyltransferase (DUF342 family)